MILTDEPPIGCPLCGNMAQTKQLTPEHRYIVCPTCTEIVVTSAAEEPLALLDSELRMRLSSEARATTDASFVYMIESAQPPMNLHSSAQPRSAILGAATAVLALPEGDGPNATPPPESSSTPSSQNDPRTTHPGTTAA